MCLKAMCWQVNQDLDEGLLYGMRHGPVCYVRRHQATRACISTVLTENRVYFVSNDQCAGKILFSRELSESVATVYALNVLEAPAVCEIDLDVNLLLETASVPEQKALNRLTSTISQ